MKDSNIVVLGSDNISLLGGNENHKVYDICSIESSKSYTRVTENIRYETFDRVWIMHIDSSKNVLLMAYKTKPKLDYYIYGEYCGTGKMELNSGFVKYLNTSNLLGGQENHINLSNVITIDISSKNIQATLYENDLYVKKIIHSYDKKMSNPNNKFIDIESMRKESIDRVSLYKVGDYYLIIGFSKKSKSSRRVFQINRDFMKYLNTVQEFKLGIPGLGNFDTKPVHNTDIGSHPVVAPITPLVDTVTRTKINKKNRVDEILDKVSLLGIRSITIEERHYLDNN
jgi:hypothetical protein